jgi:uncharacterized secreted protein with C-terminal beta-propeller domain
MTRPKHTEEKVRLNLDLPKSIRERIERVRTMIEADSLTEVVRRSISLFEALIEFKSEGARIIIRNKNGSEIEIYLP